MPATSQMASKERSEDTKLKYDAPSMDKIHTENIESVDEDAGIEWSNLIFLPFHPVFQKLVLICVIIKTYVVSTYFEFSSTSAFYIFGSLFKIYFNK